MDKGSNISFPSDSGSTVYNGSGISVGGKASTDILHAAGGTTKIKTLNGESILGEEDMITQRKTIIPIFNYKLTIVIFDRWEELEGSIP